jgi:hypothetical protein
VAGDYSLVHGRVALVLGEQDSVRWWVVGSDSGMGGMLQMGCSRSAPVYAVAVHDLIAAAGKLPCGSCWALATTLNSMLQSTCCMPHAHMHAIHHCCP